MFLGHGKGRRSSGGARRKPGAPTAPHNRERASRYFGTPEGAIGVARSDCGDVLDA